MLHGLYHWTSAHTYLSLEASGMAYFDLVGCEFG